MVCRECLFEELKQTHNNIIMIITFVGRLLHLWEKATVITLVGTVDYTCGKCRLLHLWEEIITLVGGYYTCGKKFLHLWELLHPFRIITLVGVTGCTH